MEIYIKWIDNDYAELTFDDVYTKTSILLPCKNDIKDMVCKLRQVADELESP